MRCGKNISESFERSNVDERYKGESKNRSDINVYTEAIRLSNSGLDIDKISKKLFLARGEVELLLKLRRRPDKITYENVHHKDISN
ncbi:hypothetical protein PITCH_A1470025 [uncultured Desulfobacterium sp.]|uniref:HTH luxR-type domain-containing protein n=1 Tax=uncultured Desulfobacterium sp. TaxID=201089 RepID=A0A445MT89_9BACT|nr:hypothetical protein PITCH_A1470025 [uncultured Desulfobacterium sp.]